jgi:hypothetical protein
MKTSLLNMAWQPAAVPLSSIGKSMGQQTPAPIPPLIESPELTSAVDFVAMAASGFLSYTLFSIERPNRTWGLIWALVSVGSGVKFLHDLSR